MIKPGPSLVCTPVLKSSRASALNPLSSSMPASWCTSFGLKSLWEGLRGRLRREMLMRAQAAGNTFPNGKSSPSYVLVARRMVIGQEAHFAPSRWKYLQMSWFSGENSCCGERFSLWVLSEMLKGPLTGINLCILWWDPKPCDKEAKETQILCNNSLVNTSAKFPCWDTVMASQLKWGCGC